MPQPWRGDAARPRVLVLCPEAPWPMHGGGAIRTASLIRYFAERAAVDLILFRDTARPDPPLPGTSVHRTSYIDLQVHRRDTLARVLRNGRRWLLKRPPLMDRFAGYENELTERISGERYQLAVVEHFWCAPYLDVLRSACDRVWLDLHNIESEWHETMSRHSLPFTRLVLRTFARAARRLERDLLPRFDTILVTSEHEAANVRKITTDLHPLVYPNALEFIGLPARHEEDAIAFSGNLEYQPNVDAIRYFRREIWPVLRERHGGLRWRIIGRNPAAIARLVRGEERIELTGPVEDAISELARAKVSVAPVLAGSGTRLKIIEAWAAGTPVVSTSFGAQGLGAVPGRDILIADDARAFADAISVLLSSPEQRMSLSAAGRRVYEGSYTWEAAWGALASHSPEEMSWTQSLYTG